MAESSSSTPAMAKFLPTKTVQEILTEGEQVPEKYFHKDGVPDPNAFVEVMDAPVIDLGLLKPSTFSMEEFDKLISALTKWGCFQKLKYQTPVNDIEGYGNDMVFSEQQILDWTDRLYLTIHPQEQRKLKFWPENPKFFRDTLDQYTSKIHVIAETVLKGMARSLDLEEDSFLEKYGEQRKMDVRFNFYPPCPRPESILGVKPHAEGTIITILLQDKEVESLQFLKDNQWFRAPIIPEALLINVGDQAEILTNGMFKSPVH